MNKHPKRPIRIAIFASGNGSNCENIIQYFAHSDDITVALVVSNRRDAFVLERASRHNIASVVVPREDFGDEKRLCQLLKDYEIDFVVLAGFLLMIPSFLIKKYPRRIVNIHPALLPKYGGKGMYGIHVHEAVKNAGEKRTGITIHYVNEECDGGDIIAQYAVALAPKDTVQDIASKVHELEMRHYPEVIEKVLRK